MANRPQTKKLTNYFANITPIIKTSLVVISHKYLSSGVEEFNYKISRKPFLFEIYFQKNKCK